MQDPRVLEAMRQVPREAFVPEELVEFAYDDAPPPIGEGQTISQPYIVALTAELAEVGSDDRVLDIGTGSGYAAAVLSRMAARVFTIERHPELAEAARERLARLGYNNVEVSCGDGTSGWAEEAPFDAIVVAAGGPKVPRALRDQLAIGGRLVIPVSVEGFGQRLLRLHRPSEDAFEEEQFGEVALVPLVGVEGWRESERELPTDQPSPPAPAPLWVRTPPADVEAGNPVELIAAAAEPLPDLADPAFGRSFDRFGDARVVLIGEATHGTFEFYRARAEITKRLIAQYGFTTVAVEADWPDAARIDRYVRGRADGAAGCEQAVIATLRDLLSRRLEYAAADAERYLDAAQNARLVAAAERYYRIMYYSGAESWNLRDRHMFETLEAVLAARGPGRQGGGPGAQLPCQRRLGAEMGKVRGELAIGRAARPMASRRA